MPKVKLTKEALKINPEKVCSKIGSFIKENAKAFERDGVILGLSGGIDSTVAAYLAVSAVGRKNVLALIMPERDSAPETVKDAVMAAKKLGIKYKIENLTSKLIQFGAYKLPVKFSPLRGLKAAVVRDMFRYYRWRTGQTPFYTSLLGLKAELMGKPISRFYSNALACNRIKHRLRMVMLYFYAERRNLLVVGAANKTEHLVGFFIKHGVDDASDIMPLLGLYKTQVRQIARYLGVPKKIFEKAPSPDILPGLTDEYALDIAYEKLDLVLLGLERRMGVKEIAKQLNLKPETVKYVIGLNKRSAHMRELPYFPKV